MATADDLSATVAEMRRLGVTRLKTEHLEIDLGPAIIEATPAKPTGEAEGDDATKDEREWDRRWRKLLRSSGSPVPPFPTKRMQLVKP